MKQYGAICTLALIISLIGCNPGDLLTGGDTPTLTPTFELAQFTTPASTPTSKAQSPLPTKTATIPIATNQAIKEPETTLQISPTSLAVTTPVAVTTPGATVAPKITIIPTRSATPRSSPVSTPPPLAGRIAFPVDDGGGHYDIWVVELPDGEPYLVQARASQPNFAADGRLLLNMQGSDLGESIALLDSNNTWLGIINQSPEDSYPFWHPDGAHYAYSNGNLVLDPTTAHLAPYIFTPCSLQLPRFEPDVKCQDVRFGAKMVLGEAPVWTDNDQIVFFSYKGDDGLYFVERASAFWETGWVDPPQLLVLSNGFPTDTAGSQVFFSAGNIDENWEAYGIDLDGNNLINLSQSPQSQDGLPTVSPDGHWVAFVSDRDGKWGIWVVPRRGGEPQKVVDISVINTRPSPWGTDRRAWMTERISWGP